MKRLFFIYSLPRSGSAWLSNFLSQPGVFCYHEPLADGSIKDLEARMVQRPEECVGAIDTSAYQREERVAGATDYALFRSKGEILASLRRKGYAGEELDYAVELFNKRVQDCHPIYHMKLGDLWYLRELWSQIVGTRFDEERAERLIEMNVQRTFASVYRRVKKCHPTLA